MFLKQNQLGFMALFTSGDPVSVEGSDKALYREEFLADIVFSINMHSADAELLANEYRLVD